MARLTLSFDNGPHPEGTPHVLDCLERRGLKSCFFVLGKHVASEPGRSLLDRIKAAGHRIGNHSFSHETPLGRDPRAEAVNLELERTERLLEGAGVSERLFRPFGGEGAVGPHLLSEAALRWLEERRMTCVLWNSVPGDFRDPDGWVERALEDLRQKDRVLMVLHDAKPRSMIHLETFLDRVEADGHVFEPEFPEDCVLVRDGTPRSDIRNFVSA